ncbi:TolC family protein [Brevundimonas nasdae]|uniref:TolC family protein n=1 Tax=Brevundimonas nasdae TaxID=172043 RepID=UPI001913BBEC|nr:TolC family protein [Brevundimonas nasdae]MBK6025899.1 TolC family protein [Brevundimonas nasdae]
MKRPLTTTVVAAALIGLGACATPVPKERPSALRLTPPQEAVWTEDFGDPILRDLLARADLGNLDVKAALARAEQAQAAVALTRSTRTPRIEVGVAGAAGGTSLRRTRHAASPTLEAAYEADLWGRIRQMRTAVDADAAAAAADTIEARRLIAAQTVTAYVAFRAAQQAEASAQRAVAAAARRVDLMRVRTQNGAASNGEVLKAEVVRAEAEAVGREARTEVIAQTLLLEALLGGVRGLELASADLPRLPADADGLSSDAVDHRPEVQAALLRLHAADARRAAAVAAERPQFQIIAALGAPDPAIATLLDVKTLAWALAGTVTQAVVDGGAADARIAAASSEADQAEIAWRKAVVDGWTEMQLAVRREADAAAAVSQASLVDRTARTALQAAERRHREGVIDGVAMADAALAVETAQRALTQAQAQALAARVQSRLATGTGG